MTPIQDRLPGLARPSALVYTQAGTSEENIRHLQTAPAAAPVEKGQSRSALNVVKAYVGLMKPRVIELLLVTTVPAMFLAAGGLPPLGVVFWTLLGGFLSAGSANVFNSVIDRDIDERMRRTRRRPMVRELVSARAAYTFGVVTGVASILMLGLGANWLSAGLSATAILYYVFVYTLLLKRRTAQNIVWGGIAGCFPPLIGWTAVTDAVAVTPLIMFAIVFLWTPPHTWALGLRYREDYARVDVPMLPVVKDAPAVTRQMLVYTVATVLVSLAVWPAAPTGPLYPAVAVLAGVWFVAEAVRLLRRAHAGLRDAELQPMRLFHASNSYLALICVAMALDPLLF